MPYIFNQTAKKKSPYYAKVIEADKAKQLKAAEEAKKRMEISGSIVDATNPIRDENGFLLSYESPDKQGQSIEEDYQLVRLQVRQNSGTTDRVIKFFGNDVQFLEIFPRENEEEENDVDIDALQAELDGEIERNQVLNNSLTDAINGLNKKIAARRCLAPMMSSCSPQTNRLYWTTYARPLPRRWQFCNAEPRASIRDQEF